MKSKVSSEEPTGEIDDTNSGLVRQELRVVLILQFLARAPKVNGQQCVSSPNC
jgi:hypothetical protein